MEILEDIRDVFSIFHDGSISGYSGDFEKLTLEIDCQYLANRIDKDFDKFYIELIDVNKFDFDPWMNPPSLEKNIISDLKEIIKADLEINSAEIKEDIVIITCLQHDTSYDFCGGHLSLVSSKIKVFDQNKNKLTIDELGLIAHDYWDNFGTKRKLKD